MRGDKQRQQRKPEACSYLSTAKNARGSARSAFRPTTPRRRFLQLTRPLEKVHTIDHRDRHLLAASFEPRSSLSESRLYVHHAELPVFHFLMCGHGPQKCDSMARNRNVRVISIWHEHGVSVAHYGHQFRIPSIGVSKACHKTACFHILGDEHAQITRGTRTSRHELQYRVFHYLSVADDLQRILARHVGRKLGKVYGTACGKFNR